jgi:hypothetical protein
VRPGDGGQTRGGVRVERAGQPAARVAGHLVVPGDDHVGRRAQAPPRVQVVHGQVTRLLGRRIGGQLGRYPLDAHLATRCGEDGTDQQRGRLRRRKQALGRQRRQHRLGGRLGQVHQVVEEAPQTLR